MSGDKQQTNGQDQQNDSVNGAEDVEMNDGSSKPSKGTKSGKDGDEEMTVVVPPSKKTAPAPGKDPKSKDAANGASEEADEAAKEPEIDPREKAINGMYQPILHLPNPPTDISTRH
jgi:26S proteasome regulatory subunit N3